MSAIPLAFELASLATSPTPLALGLPSPPPTALPARNSQPMAPKHREAPEPTASAADSAAVATLEGRLAELEKRTAAALSSAREEAAQTLTRMRGELEEAEQPGAVQDATTYPSFQVAALLPPALTLFRRMR